MITNHLSPVDTACFALCNHATLFVLGRDVWDTVDAFPSDRKVFLNRLAADMLLFYFCHVCSILHHRDRYSLPAPTFLRRFSNLFYHEVGSLRPFFVHPEQATFYSFYFYHLQLAMKRHYYGPEQGISTDSLQFTEVYVEPQCHATSLLSVEARICSGPCLCLRVQS